jgi:hypothetical protein
VRRVNGVSEDLRVLLVRWAREVSKDLPANADIPAIEARLRLALLDRPVKLGQRGIRVTKAKASQAYKVRKVRAVKKETKARLALSGTLGKKATRESAGKKARLELPDQQAKKASAVLKVRRASWRALKRSRKTKSITKDKS